MKNVYRALFEARKEFPHIHKGGKGQFGDYDRLEDILDGIKPALEKHGLLALQTVDNDSMVTRIVHVESGEMLEDRYPLVPDGAGPQKLGSAVTYARRYSLRTILGLATEGDPDAATNTAPYGHLRHPLAGAPSTAAPKGLPGVAGKQIKMFKKYSGMTYGQVPMNELMSSKQWLEDKAREDKKPLSAQAREFVDDVNAIANDLSQAFADDERIPF